jgi:hypothetical protein
MANMVNPSEARYCASLMIGKTFCPDHGTKCRDETCKRTHGTATDDSIAYFDSKPTAGDLAAMVPDGWYRLVFPTVRKCKRY